MTFRTDDPNISKTKPGRVPLEARFDYQPGDRTPSPHDQAKSSFWALPVARMAVLRFWTKYALKHSRPGVGWTQDAPRPSVTASHLALLAQDDCLFEVEDAEMVGVLLFEKHMPTISTSHKPYAQQKFAVEYVGIPLGLSQQWDDLRAAA